MEYLKADPELRQDLSKAVVEPIVEVAPISSLRGFKDDFGSLEQEVVLLEGETHIGRKPVSPVDMLVHTRLLITP
jgi:hypothetical protein